MSDALPVVHLATSLAKRYGGPARSVPALAAAQAELGAAATLLAPRDAEESQINLPQAQGLGVQLLDPQDLRFSAMEACASVEAHFGKPVLHTHGLWSPMNRAGANAAAALGATLVTSVRGMLHPDALRQKRLKKWLGWRLFQRRDLWRCAAWHATSEEEAQHCRAAGWRGPVIVLPNGVELPPPDSATLKAQPKQALLLARLHPGKGIVPLLEAWATLRPAGWELVIAGPDEAGHEAEVRAALRRLALTEVVTLAGELDGAAKWRAYRQASLSVLPTKFENFGLAIAESLACGVPAITTKGAPWAGLAEQRCGWWIEHGVEPLRAALTEATARPPAELAAMGERGRVWVEQAFAWPGVAADMLASYRWLRGDGPMPDCVRKD